MVLGEHDYSITSESNQVKKSISKVTNKLSTWFLVAYIRDALLVNANKKISGMSNSGIN